MSLSDKYIGPDPVNKPQYYKQGAHITIEELGMSVAGSEALAQDVLDGVTDWVFQYTGLDTQYERREEVDGNGARRILLANYPCQYLLDVQVHTRIDNWIDITAYTRLLEHGELILIPSYFHWHFPEGVRNIRVRYVAGLTKLHPLMRLVIIEICQIILFKYGILGSANIADNPALADAVAQYDQAIAESGTSTKGIKQVEIKSLSVTFTDDIRSTTDIIRNPIIRRGVLNKLIDDLFSKDPSYLKRLDVISKYYCNG